MWNSWEKRWKQAGAELGQVKLDAIIEVIVEVGAEVVKRLLEMSSVAENNRLIPAIDKLDN